MPPVVLEPVGFHNDIVDDHFGGVDMASAFGHDFVIEEPLVFNNRAQFLQQPHPQAQHQQPPPQQQAPPPPLPEQRSELIQIPMGDYEELGHGQRVPLLFVCNNADVVTSGDAELSQGPGLKRELSPMDEVAALDDWSAPPPASKKHDTHSGAE